VSLIGLFWQYILFIYTVYSLSPLWWNCVCYLHSKTKKPLVTYIKNRHIHIL